MVDWLVGWLVELIDWLIGWLVGWLIDWNHAALGHDLDLQMFYSCIDMAGHGRWQEHIASKGVCRLPQLRYVSPPTWLMRYCRAMASLADSSLAGVFPNSPRSDLATRLGKQGFFSLNLGTSSHVVWTSDVEVLPFEKIRLANTLASLATSPPRRPQPLSLS